MCGRPTTISVSVRNLHKLAPGLLYKLKSVLSTLSWACTHEYTLWSVYLSEYTLRSVYSSQYTPRSVYSSEYTPRSVYSTEYTLLHAGITTQS